MDTSTTPAPLPRTAPGRLATVDIVIPVLDEERALPGCIETLCAFLEEGFPFDWSITIADNGSTDGTWQCAVEAARRHDRVQARRVPVRGRGAAVKSVWAASRADIVAYMDVDLSTGLDALLPLIAPLATGHCELSIGTRLGRGARIRRSVRRELVSRTYNGIVRNVLGLHATDTSAGFKAARTDAVRPLLASVEDDHWFFDTELLLLAEYNGLRVHEVPVDWVEDLDTRVRVTRTALANLAGLVRMGRSIAAGRARVPVPHVPGLRAMHPDAVLPPNRSATLGRVLGFVVVGVLSTALFALLYLVLRLWLDPAVANLGALLLVGVVNTEGNRRWTFNREGGPRLALHLRAAVVFGVSYLVATGTVGLLGRIAPEAGPAVEASVLVTTYAVLTLVRYLVLSRWVFARR